jgi:hypothetical protein
MKKLLILACVMFAGCDEAANIREQKENNTALATAVIKDSFLTCSDGNVVRVVSRYMNSQAGLMTVWTVLNDDGKPKKCKLRPRASAVQYEEVPQ